MYGNTVKDGSGNSWWILVDSNGRIITSSPDAVSIQAEATADDSDKTLTVPASTIWELVSLFVTLVTTADVGDRLLNLKVTDGSDNVLLDIRVGAVQAASITRYYNIAPGLPDLTSFRDTDSLMTPMPTGIVLPAGYKVRVYDNNAIAPSADDMTIRLLIKSHAV